MRVILMPANPNSPMAVHEVSSLMDMQKLVGGSIEVALRVFSKHGAFAMVANEEGLLLDLPLNPRASLMCGSEIAPGVHVARVIVGDVFLAGTQETIEGDEDFTSIPPMVEHYILHNAADLN